MIHNSRRRFTKWKVVSSPLCNWVHLICTCEIEEAFGHTLNIGLGFFKRMKYCVLLFDMAYGDIFVEKFKILTNIDIILL
jgi:hypothetical protein